MSFFGPPTEAQSRALKELRLDCERFVRDDAAWAWMDRHLTVDRLRALLPEAADLPIERHRLPAIRSLNFVIRGLLGEGVAASSRQDGQAKSLGEWVRARIVDLPVALLPEDLIGTDADG